MLYSALSSPIICQVELTSACNCNCLYCYNHWRHGGGKLADAHMNGDILAKTLDQIIASEVFQVVFTGGECMLMKDALFHGLQKLIDKGIGCTVNSNLTLVTEQDAKTLHQIGLRGILTSISSHDPTVHDRIFHRRGVFDKAMRGIKICMNEGIGVGASMVLIKENAEHVISTGLMLKSAGVRQFYATKASPPVNALDFQRFMLDKSQLLKVMDDLNVLRHQHGMHVGILECYPLCSYGLPEKYPFVAERRCSAGVTTVTIGSNGDVRPCSHSDVIYGNVAREGLRASWESMHDQRDGSLLPVVCRQCSLLSHCSGGCRVDAKCCSGRYDALDPYADPQMVSKITPLQREIGVLDNLHLLRVNPLLKSRKESIGVLCTDPTAMTIPAMLTEDTFDLVKELIGREFTVHDVCEVTGLQSEDAKRLCELLFTDRIFVKVIHN